MEHIPSIAQLLCISEEESLKTGFSLSEIEQEIRRQMVEAGRQALTQCLENLSFSLNSKTEPLRVLTFICTTMMVCALSS